MSTFVATKPSRERKRPVPMCFVFSVNFEVSINLSLITGCNLTSVVPKTSKKPIEIIYNLRKEADLPTSLARLCWYFFAEKAVFGTTELRVFLE